MKALVPALPSSLPLPPASPPFPRRLLVAPVPAAELPSRSESSRGRWADRRCISTFHLPFLLVLFASAPNRRRMLRLLSTTLLLLAATAQANIFDFFGQNSQQAQQPQTGTAQYRALRQAGQSCTPLTHLYAIPSLPQRISTISDALRMIAPCSTYICPATLQCVTTPRDCDCPNFQDVKCAVGKDHVVCARNCDAVTAALKFQD